MERDSQQTPELPKELIERLRSADRHVPVITARVDREILALAEAQFAGLEQAGWKPRASRVAIAASVIIALFIGIRNLPVAQDPLTNPDIDGSGRVDIADVLALARSKDSGEISQAEIDAFAMRIVSLNPEGDAS